MEITELQSKILELLEGNGWMSHREVSEKLGRGHVNPYDRKMLESLNDLGLVETRDESLGVVKTRRMYRKVNQ